MDSNRSHESDTKRGSWCTLFSGFSCMMSACNVQATVREEQQHFAGSFSVGGIARQRTFSREFLKSMCAYVCVCCMCVRECARVRVQAKYLWACSCSSKTLAIILWSTELPANVFIHNLRVWIYNRRFWCYWLSVCVCEWVRVCKRTCERARIAARLCR